MTPSRVLGALAVLLTPWFWFKALDSMGHFIVIALTLAVVWLVAGVVAIVIARTARAGEAERLLLGFAAFGAFACWIPHLGLMAVAVGMGGFVLGAGRGAKRLAQVLPFVVLMPAVAMLHAYGGREALSSTHPIPPMWLIGHAVLLAIGGLSFALEGSATKSGADRSSRA